MLAPHPSSVGHGANAASCTDHWDIIMSSIVGQKVISATFTEPTLVPQTVKNRGEGAQGSIISLTTTSAWVAVLLPYNICPSEFYQSSSRSSVDIGVQHGRLAAGHRLVPVAQTESKSAQEIWGHAILYVVLEGSTKGRSSKPVVKI